MSQQDLHCRQWWHRLGLNAAQFLQNRLPYLSINSILARILSYIRCSSSISELNDVEVYELYVFLIMLFSFWMYWCISLLILLSHSRGTLPGTVLTTRMSVKSSNAMQVCNTPNSTAVLFWKMDSLICTNWMSRVLVSITCLIWYSYCMSGIR